MTQVIRIIRMWRTSWKHLVSAIRLSLTLSRLRKEKTTLSIMLRRPMSSPLWTAPDISDLLLTIVMMMETWYARRGTASASSSFLMLSNSTQPVRECPSLYETTKTTRSWSSAKAPIQSSKNASNRTKRLLKQRSNSWMTLPRLVCVHFWSPARRLPRNTITNGRWTTSKRPLLTIRRKKWIECQTSLNKTSTFSARPLSKTNFKKMLVKPFTICDRLMWKCGYWLEIKLRQQWILAMPANYSITRWTSLSFSQRVQRKPVRR